MTDKTMTENDAMHLVAREVAKQRMADMERMLSEGERRTIATMAEIKLQISAQTILIEKQTVMMEKQADALRDEIKRDFATKAEVEANKQEMDYDFEKLNAKIDAQWNKLTLIVAVITAGGVFFQWLVSVSGHIK